MRRARDGGGPVAVGHPDPDLVHPLAVGEAAGHPGEAEIAREPRLEDRPWRKPACRFDLVELVVVPVADDAVEVEHDGLDGRRAGTGWHPVIIAGANSRSRRTLEIRLSVPANRVRADGIVGGMGPARTPCE